MNPGKPYLIGVTFPRIKYGNPRILRNSQIVKADRRQPPHLAGRRQVCARMAEWSR